MITSSFLDNNKIIVYNLYVTVFIPNGAYCEDVGPWIYQRTHSNGKDQSKGGKVAYRSVLERFLDPELLRKSGYDKLKIVTGGADHSVSAIVREVAAKLNIPCLVGDGWGVVGSHFYRACDIVAQYGDTGDSWCKQQEEDFRRTKPENPFHLLF